MKIRKHSRLHVTGVSRFAYVFLGLMCLVFLFPLFGAVMVSITSEESLLLNGYQLIPEAFSLEAYRTLIEYYGSELLRSVVLTVGTGILQPLLSIFITVLMAYPLSQPDFKGRGFWRRFLVVTMLFSGGLVPNYILRTRYLGLRDNILIYLLPTLGAWNVFLFRTFFTNIDKSMIESAKLDGASNFNVLLKIMLPLTKPLVAMNFFNGFLGRWNDIDTPLYYITNRKLYTVQYLLQEMLRSAERAKEMLEMGIDPSVIENVDFPVESVRYALAVIGAIPALLLFPFLQKYYAKGITLGSTKG